MTEAPSTRHGDVLLTVWIVVGASVFAVLLLSETFRLPPVGLAAVGALAAGYGEAVSRQLRPHVRFAETAVGVVVAFLLLPHVARFRAAAPFDRDTLVTIAVGMPLGLAAAWQVRKAKIPAGGRPEIIAGIFLSSAAVALGVILLITIQPQVMDLVRAFEVAFLVTSIAAGVTMGALVPSARYGHLILGAMCVLLAPRILQLGGAKHMPLYDVIRWTGALGVGGTLGCLAGQRLRTHLASRAVAAPALPQARVHDGDAGESHDSR